MSNIIDYMKWRGDLKFTNDAFNEVDNVILAELSYIDFAGIVPSRGKGGIKLKEAAKIFLRSFKKKEIEKRGVYLLTPVEILRNARKCRRFSEIMLYNYVEEISSDKNTQFSAISMELDDRSLYISYSGTDSTIAGWRENFAMSFTESIPAQQKAVDYINEVAEEKDGVLRVGGHSKGGNLAIYAAIYCEAKIKKRIKEIFNNDGPGFTRKSVPKEDYETVADKVKTLIPADSIVGLLLEHEETAIVVESTSSGVAQHDAGNWQLERTKFVRAKELSSAATLLNKAIVNWLARLNPDEKREFINTVFDILQDNNIKSTRDFMNISPEALFNILKEWNRANSQKEDIIGKTMKLFWEESGNALKEEIGKFIDKTLPRKKRSK